MDNETEKLTTKLKKIDAETGKLATKLKINCYYVWSSKKIYNKKSAENMK